MLSRGLGHTRRHPKETLRTKLMKSLWTSCVVSVVGGLPTEHHSSYSAVAMADPTVIPSGACSVWLVWGGGEPGDCLPGK